MEISFGKRLKRFRSNGVADRARTGILFGNLDTVSENAGFCQRLPYYIIVFFFFQRDCLNGRKDCLNKPYPKQKTAPGIFLSKL